LYQAFANDLHNKIDLNDFLAGLSIVGSQERGPFLRFLFRVYDVRQAGRLDRRDVEKLLSIAYGDRFKSAAHSINRHLDALFALPQSLIEHTVPGREKTVSAAHGSRPLTLKEFQHFEGRLDVLGTVGFLI
jgi:Ca2+-binding EF-hand superfamily protein